MKRIVIHKPGGHAALELEEGPLPEPQTGEIRIRVRAVGINYADILLRMGLFPGKGLYPVTPGFEFAGTIEKLGKDARDWQDGEAVFGSTRFGAYSEFICVPQRQIFRCPAGWGFEDCAAFPSVFLSAYGALFQAAKVQKGDLLLIHSAAGGVGLALLQLARLTGCKSIAVVGYPHKAEICKQFGAEAIIDRSSQNLWREADRLAPGGFDSIFDSNGFTTVREGFNRLASGGRLVIYGWADMAPRAKQWRSLFRIASMWIQTPSFSPLELLHSNRGVVGFNVTHLFDRVQLADEIMRRLLGWVADGKIQKLPLTVFPLNQAAEAHRAIESGKTVGKLVLTVPAL